MDYCLCSDVSTSSAN